MNVSDSCMVVNWRDISDDLTRAYKLTREEHPDASTCEVGLPWVPDGLLPVETQFTIGLLRSTLVRIQKILERKCGSLWKDFVERLKSPSVHKVRIGDTNIEDELDLSDFVIELDSSVGG